MNAQSPNSRRFRNYFVYQCFTLVLFVTAPIAFAETHAVIPTTPATVVNGSNKTVAVDSIWHIIYTVNGSGAVQATYFSGGGWHTAALGSQAAAVISFLYVDTGYHFVHYVGSNNALWCWYFNGSTWVNVQLSGSFAQNIAGVDSSSHIIWFTNISTLFALYYNGTAWVTAASGVTDYFTYVGGVVDDTSHSLYWNDSNSFILRRLVWTGRDFASATLALDTNADAYIRPTVHPITGEVYSRDKTTARPFRYLPGFHYTRQDVGPAGTQTKLASPSLAINPLSGKLISCLVNGGNSEVDVIAPNAGTSDTWPRTTVAGTSGQVVTSCAMDNGYGWYCYTITGGTDLHIVY